MPETPVEELRAAKLALQDLVAPPRVLVVSEEGYADKHMLVLCDHDHAPPALLDRYDCCQDCRYIDTYDPELAAQLTRLFGIAAPLTTWLEAEARHWDAVRIAGATRPDDHGLTVARVINGGTS